MVKSDSQHRLTKAVKRSSSCCLCTFPVEPESLRTFKLLQFVSSFSVLHKQRWRGEQFLCLLPYINMYCYVQGNASLSPAFHLEALVFPLKTHPLSFTKCTKWVSTSWLIWKLHSFDCRRNKLKAKILLEHYRNNHVSCLKS